MPAMTNPLIRIYGLAPFDRGAKARWLLTELNVPFESHWLDREKKEHESPEYLKINPMGRAPAAQIGDSVMFESNAICAYLADLYIARGIAPSLTAPGRARYQQWLHFADSTIANIQTRIMIIEDMAPGEVRTQKESALFEELHDAMTAMDQALTQSTHIVSNEFSAADICVSYHLYWCTLWPELDAIIQKFPRVIAYMDRMKNMPSAITAKVFSFEG
jgi:glutathione S-transferase